MSILIISYFIFTAFVKKEVEDLKKAMTDQTTNILNSTIENNAILKQIVRKEVELCMEEVKRFPIESKEKLQNLENCEDNDEMVSYFTEMILKYEYEYKIVRFYNFYFFFFQFLNHYIEKKFEQRRSKKEFQSNFWGKNNS